ncbi:Hypothetical protein FRAAL4533 [Frankia alni ACN14a]|uniref:Uncharacterized protein n=1 Tax=Frankia alni (strain DSM 45986 / CECT 9034 / ACN14a) TaxID=326424 RepID=Q0RH58_FRAAA|nr:Hypothetical protein FRAAL4533 [Frankia alni ACN14a]
MAVPDRGGCDPQWGDVRFGGFGVMTATATSGTMNEVKGIRGEQRGSVGGRAGDVPHLTGSRALTPRGGWREGAHRIRGFGVCRGGGR